MPGLVGLFAFVSLGFMALTQSYYFFAIFIIVIGICFVALACHNTYKNKSTELLDRYEERFFIRMKKERRLAAQYLLKKTENSAHLKWVLDYLESPIGSKVLKGQIETYGVYEYFRHWIELYWQASQEDIENYRKDDPGAWPSLKTLYDTMIAIEKKELKDQYIPWSPQRIKNALEDEASL